jgi:hypothetical protein
MDRQLEAISQQRLQHYAHLVFRRVWPLGLGLDVKPIRCSPLWQLRQ